MEKMILVIISFLVCGSGLFLHNYKWQELYRRLGVHKVKDVVEITMEAEKEAERQNLKELPVYVQHFCPLLFLLLFILELAGVRYLPQTELSNQGPVIIALFAIAIPFILVMTVVMKETKSDKTKFVLSLIFALIMELLAVASIGRMLDGYYFGNAIRFKRLGNFVLTIVLTGGAMYTAHINWLKLYTRKAEADSETE